MMGTVMQAEHSSAAEAVLATLPAHTSSPMLWANEERRDMLRGSPALEEAEQLEADVRGEWASISSAAESSSNALTSTTTACLLRASVGMSLVGPIMSALCDRWNGRNCRDSLAPSLAEEINQCLPAIIMT